MPDRVQKIRDLNQLIGLLKQTAMNNKSDETLSLLKQIKSAIALSRHEEAASSELFTQLDNLFLPMDESNYNVLEYIIHYMGNEHRLIIICIFEIAFNFLKDLKESAEPILNYLNKQSHAKPRLNLGMFLAADGSVDCDSIEMLAYLFMITRFLDEFEAHPEKILEHLNMRNDNGDTLGMFIARKFNAESLRVYLKLIEKILDSKQISPEKILEHLNFRNNYDRTFGIMIAAKFSDTEFQSYLNLMQKLIDVAGAHPDKIIEHLNLKTKIGNTLVSTIAINKQGALTGKAILSYLAFLKNLLNNPLCDPDKICEHLNLRYSDDTTLGMLIATNFGNVECQRYLELLDKLLDKKVIDPNKLLDHLNLSAKKGNVLALRIIYKLSIKEIELHLKRLHKLLDEEGTDPNKMLGHLTAIANGILGHITPESLQSYFDLLNRLFEKKVDPNKLVEHLTATYLSIAMNLVSKATIAHLSLLHSLVDKREINLDKILVYLNQRDHQQNTFGMLIIKHCSQNEVRSYFNLLQTLWQQKNVPVAKIISLLYCQNIHDEMLGTLIATSRHADIPIFVDFFISLAIAGAPKEKLEFLLRIRPNTPNGYGYRELPCVLDKMQKYPQLFAGSLYQLFQLELITLCNMHLILDYEKHILAAIKAIPDLEEKQKALEEAAGMRGEDNQLYQLFKPTPAKRQPSRRGGFFSRTLPPPPPDPIQTEIQQELAKLAPAPPPEEPVATSSARSARRSSLYDRAKLPFVSKLSGLDHKRFGK